jgi:hypothetical protein
VTVSLDSRRLERGFEMRELFDPNDATVGHVDDPGPAAEEVGTAALERALVGRIGFDTRETHAHDDAIREAERAIDTDVVALRDALGDYVENTIAVDEHGLLPDGDPLDIGIEHPRKRFKVACHEGAVPAEKKLDPRVTHAAESMELNGPLSNPLESSKNALDRLRCVVRALLERERLHRESRLLQPRPGKIAEAVRAVVGLREAPIRMVEIHAAVESLLGEPINRGTVKHDLSAGVVRGEYVRVARGQYLPHRLGEKS